MLNMFKKADDKGFTLIELLIVIAIIGVLAAIAVPIFLSQTDNADEAAAQAEASGLETLMIAGVALGDTTVNGTGSAPSTYTNDAGSVTITDGSWIANYVGSTNYCVSVTVGASTASYGTGAVYNSATTACDAPA